ncbi:MAG TPA: Calx-beta domain-containing protein, partial [Verrucomicrobiae bacterium]
NSFIVTNIVVALAPTNVLFSFEKANYRVPEDVNDTTGDHDGWTQVALYVERFGTNGVAQVLNYRINNEEGDDASASEEQNNFFPLQPASDYAAPVPSTIGTIRGLSSDFVPTGNYSYSGGGTISFPSSGVGADLQEITFTVTNSLLTKFNRDFKIELYREAPVSPNGPNEPWISGMVAETTVTILANDQNPPAGSVDEVYNADFNNLLALPPSKIPSTIPQKDANPGVGALGSGYVKSLAVLPNNETLIGGDFVSYNGFFNYNNNSPLSDIALIDQNGQLDQTFSPNSGADAPINALAVTTGGQYIIGGNFLSFNGQFQNYLARLNRDGSLDTSFNPVINGPVNAVLLQPDGKVVLGGSFTSVDSQGLNGLARLNTDGSLDTAFNPGTTLNGTVNALAQSPGIYINRISNGTTNEDDVVLPVSTSAIGLATVRYAFPITNELQVFYGGSVIFDTGVIVGNGRFTVPFGPGSSPLVLVTDPGGTLMATNWSYKATIVTNSDIVAGGNFTVSGQSYANVARFTTNGVLDTTFSNILSGADNTVYALGWQTSGNLVVGGAFANFNGLPNSAIACLNWDGSLNTNSFFAGTGANDIIWNINVQSDGTIYVGGQFSEFNGTHRLGFTRLYSNGTVDTTFMDTAYNQFAGLKKVFADDFEAVYTSGVETDSNVLIGGQFNQVGGGQANTNVCDILNFEEGLQYESFLDPNLWVEPKTRDGVRNRDGLARLIGGATPGPGNIQMQLPAYSANKSQASLSVGLVRTNGALGPISANFSVIPGLAASGSDYSYNSTPPLFWVASQFTTHLTRDRSDGLFGLNGSLEDVYGLFLTLADLPLNNQSAVTVSVINNAQKSGNENAGFQLANPSSDNEFYLGSENIPLGAALGANNAPFTLIDNTSQAGTLSFLSTNYIATNSLANITVVRSNGVFGIVSMRCFATNGTAIAGTDYWGVTNFSLQFGAGVTSNAFTVTILANGLVSTNFVEKTISLSLASLTGGNATFGISNAVLSIINPNFQGYLTLTATNYTG